MYVKQYDSNGLVSNPITKEQPFINVGENRQQRRFTQRKSNNRKGHGLVVAKIGPTSFMKYKVVKQHTKNNMILHTVAV